MHAALFGFACFGGLFGWVWKRLHYSYQDWQAAIARHKNARRVLRREILWSAGAAVVAYLVIRGLLL